ncbi:MAG: response regulator transcription factor [Bacteroidetes bacterium]|nr:response regulator transcription factor [Bacteroidota bacterium]
MSDTINILIADDHQVFIDGLKIHIQKDKRFNVVAEALNGDDALKKIKTQKIDLLMTDINMPGMDGVELTKNVKKEFPHIKVFVLTMHNDREIVSEILMAEAEGYVLKNTGKNQLLEALNAIADGSTYYSNEILSIMMEKVRKEKKQEEETRELSEREIEVLKLIAQEYSSGQIAEKLFISRRTVDTHRIHIFEKTKTKTIVGLIKFAIRNGLVE